MYTCADDVLCFVVITLTCILKEGARRSKRRAAITQETRSQALTAIERILEWGTTHVPSHADFTLSRLYCPVELHVSCVTVACVKSLLSQSL